MEQRSSNVVWHGGSVGRADRERILGQRGCVVWFTGLSGSGKSTVARALEAALLRAGRLTYVLDGDNIRHGLNGDLGFSAADREENIRRIGELAALFVDAGVITLSAFISPFRRDRDLARAKVPDGRFIEVYVDVPLTVCERRDPKELYRRTRAGEIGDFTGISAPYEVPVAADVVLQTHEKEVNACVSTVLAVLRDRGILPS